MREDPYLFIVDFERLQHYKDRNPIWIKLYADLWTRPEFESLSDASKAHFIGLSVLASRHGNKIPLKIEWISKHISAITPLNLKELLASGLLAQSGKTLAKRLQVASPEKRREETEEKRVETDGRIAYGEFGNVRLSVVEHDKLEAALNGRLESLINRLDRWGEEEPAKFKRKHSHYATLLNWAERDEVKTNGSGRSKPIRETDHEKNQRAAREYLARSMAPAMRGDVPDVRQDPGGLPRKV